VAVVQYTFRTKRTSLHCKTSLHFTTLHPTTLHYTYGHFTPSHLHFTTLSFGLNHQRFLPLYFTSDHWTRHTIKLKVHFGIWILNFGWPCCFRLQVINFKRCLPLKHLHVFTNSHVTPYYTGKAVTQLRKKTSQSVHDVSTLGFATFFR